MTYEIRSESKVTRFLGPAKKLFWQIRHHCTKAGDLEMNNVQCPSLVVPFVVVIIWNECRMRSEQSSGFCKRRTLHFWKFVKNLFAHITLLRLKDNHISDGVPDLLCRQRCSRRDDWKTNRADFVLGSTWRSSGQLSKDVCASYTARNGPSRDFQSGCS